MNEIKTNNPSLLDIGSEFGFIMNIVKNEQGGELLPEQEEVIAKLLSEASDKVTKYSAVLKRFTSEKEMALLAAKEAKAYADKCERTIERLEEIAKFVMQKMEVRKLEGLYGTGFSLRESQQVEVAIEPTQLPKEYQRTKVEADKTAIKDALKAGKEIPGCRIIINHNVNWR